jgi:hypothetical protein
MVLTGAGRVDLKDDVAVLVGTPLHREAKSLRPPPYLAKGRLRRVYMFDNRRDIWNHSSQTACLDFLVRILAVHV